LTAAVLPWIASAALAVAPLVPPEQPADRPLLASVVRESAVDTEVPKPGWGQYLAVVLAAAVGSIFDGLRPLGALFRLPSRAAVLVALGFVGVVLLALLVLAIRALATRRRAAPAAAGSREEGTPAQPPDAALTASYWRREAHRRLEAGDAVGALEALWWFFARALARGDARPSWTSGELLARARRQDLRPFAIELDRFRYGMESPAASEVRDLARRLEAGVGGVGALPGRAPA
jgi:hypothetical protein